MAQTVSRWYVTAKARARSQTTASFVVDKVALEQVVLQILRFSPVSNIPPMSHARLHLNAVLTKEQSGEGWHLTRSLSFGYQHSNNKVLFFRFLRAKCCNRLKCAAGLQCK